MKCRYEINGGSGPEFDANLGPNDASTTPGDPYGSTGPLPPGEYDIKPKPTGPENNVYNDDGTVDFRKGTPSVTDTRPGHKPGQITTPNGTRRGGLRMHEPGHSQGCVTCSQADNGANNDNQRSSIENLMNTYKKPKLKIEEVCCGKGKGPAF
jgi:hypothetical protein